MAYPDDASGILAYDGWPMGSEDAGIFAYPDSGIIAYPFDGGPTGVVVMIDGSDDGSLADASNDGGVPDGTIISGGPLHAPELPA